MSFHKFPKISINILGGTFLFLIFFISLLTFNFVLLTSNALAQDAIQCTPGDINLNRNLKFVNNNNIYLGTGKLNFSGGNDGLYAANDGGNLLLKSPMAISLQSGGDFKFQNSSGNSFAQFFTGSTPTLTGAGNLLVNGKIEGLGDVQGNKVCVTGGGTQCVSSWSGVNIAAHGESRCDGVNSGALGACANVVATNDVTAAGGNVVAGSNVTAGAKVIGGQLCVPDGSKCISSWADVLQSSSGGEITIANSSLIIGNGGAIKNSGIFEVCDASGVDCFGTGRGVSKIIAGPGITITSTPADGNPGAGEGDVTISATGAAGNGGASGWRLIAQASDYTEESETTINYPDQIFFTVDSGGYPNQRVNIGNFNSWSPSATTKLIFKAKSASDDFCAGGNGALNLSGGAGTYPECQDWQLDAGGATTTYVNITDQDDWIRLLINGTEQKYCPDQLGRVSNNASYPGTYGYVNAFDVFCYYEKNTHWNGDLTSFKIQEADWSGGYGSWEWELWGCDDCVDPAGLNSSYLYQLKHTKTQCTDGVDGIAGTADDGTILNDSGRYFCKFATATDACPASWLQYNKWSTAVPRTCSDNGLCSGAGPTCTTGSHAWSDATQESCVYHHHWSNWTGCHGGDKTCYSDITEIGCY